MDSQSQPTKVQSPGHFAPKSNDEVFRNFSMTFVVLENAKDAARKANANLEKARAKFAKAKDELLDAFPDYD